MGKNNTFDSTNTVSSVIGTIKDEPILLIGYYGGGNFGDELLLEVLQKKFKDRGIHDLRIAHQDPSNFKKFHQQLGYKLIDMRSRVEFIKQCFANKTLVVGGGGLWGLDVNSNILALSILLFISRRVFGRSVLLLGVGYYGSTNKLGHISAWLAARAANKIIARDDETLKNFTRIKGKVSADRDIAWMLPDLDLKSYDSDYEAFKHTLSVTENTYFVTTRRFQNAAASKYSEHLKAWITNNNDKKIIISILEPKEVDPQGFEDIQKIAKEYKNVSAIDFSYNPVILYLFFKDFHRQLIVVGPQFHMLLIAQLAGVPYLTLSYDNKVTELLYSLGKKEVINIKELKPNTLDVEIAKLQFVGADD